MSDPRRSQKDQSTFLIREALVESWLAWTGLTVFIVFVVIQGNPIFAGIGLLVAAVLAMNGLAKTDLALIGRGPRFWREHPILNKLHQISHEGELMGITIGVIAGLFLWRQGANVHIAYAEAFTLLGIMSAANIAVAHIRPVMRVLEKVGGRVLVIAGGSLLSSLTGEPAAAVFLSDYIQARVKEKDRVRVATGLAASIGSGGGLMPFAAPPILIVWGVLSTTLGWGVGSLITFLGAGCLFHVLLTTILYYRRIEPLAEIQEPIQWRGVMPLVLLAFLVYGHVVFHSPWLYALDIVVACASWLRAHRHLRDSDQEQMFVAKWQPLVLASLLVSLEIIGTGVDPLITWIAALVPQAWPPLAIALVLFTATMIVSHIADNALASRIFITIPVAMLPILGADVAHVLAVAVLSGALFGGFLTIPANLPNFYLARIFRASPGEWLRQSWRLYWTGIVYVAWLVILFFILT